MGKPEGFEVTEYAAKENIYEKFTAIHQIVEDKVRESPSAGCRVSLSGNTMRLYYHCYEMHLPVRMKEVEAAAKTMLDEMVKHLKSEFKARTKRPLTLKEDKGLANYTVQKVSLNERYYFVTWRCYELG